MNRLGTNEQAIFDTLQGAPPAERQAIAAAYEARHGEPLEARLRRELGGTDLDRAQSLLEGDQAGADAAQLRAAMGETNQPFPDAHAARGF